KFAATVTFRIYGRAFYCIYLVVLFNRNSRYSYTDIPSDKDSNSRSFKKKRLGADFFFSKKLLKISIKVINQLAPSLVEFRKFNAKKPGFMVRPFHFTL